MLVYGVLQGKWVYIDFSHNIPLTSFNFFDSYFYINLYILICLYI